MNGLITALFLFVVLHSVPAIADIRSRIILHIGRPAYLVIYSTTSTALLAWLFYEALRTDYVELWDAAAWQVTITLVSAPLGLFFIVAGLLSPNPFSVSLRQSGPAQGAIISLTRHPVLWGFVLWAAGHIPPNGDLRSLLLFGGLAAFSLVGVFVSERRSRTRLGSRWAIMANGSSIIPFNAILTGRRRLYLDQPLVIGGLISTLVSAWLLSGGHALLVGADPLAVFYILQ
ncbi:NnrU family protein [Allorhizobium pseudoryzae]|uniref:NnrU family protein n=1 Tax=Allorhizobium pseudoryzae TaxID=379684 RepID=UPI003CFCBFC1